MVWLYKQANHQFITWRIDVISFFHSLPTALTGWLERRDWRVGLVERVMSNDR